MTSRVAGLLRGCNGIVDRSNQYKRERMLVRITRADASVSSWVTEGRKRIQLIVLKRSRIDYFWLSKTEKN